MVNKHLMKQEMNYQWKEMEIFAALSFFVWLVVLCHYRVNIIMWLDIFMILSHFIV